MSSECLAKVWNSVKKKWPDHIVTLLISLAVGFILLLIGLCTVERIVISQHRTETEVLFKQQEIPKMDSVFSRIVMVGSAGGYYSIGFNVKSETETIRIAMRYQLSFDGQIWMDRLGGADYFVSQEVKTNRWYLASLEVEPAAYLRVVLSSNDVDIEPATIDMYVFKWY